MGIYGEEDIFDVECLGLELAREGDDVRGRLGNGADISEKRKTVTG